MTVRFGNHRLGYYVVVGILAAAVLGLAANFASVFLPNIHRDFTIFALIVSSLTILVFLLQLQWAQPRSEVISLFILGILWLTMGAWSVDIIGHVQCDSLRGQTTPSKKGETSLQAFCYEMKAVEALSWALFCLFVIATIVLFQLTEQAQKYGHYNIWSEPIRELPWFGEMPGYYNTGNGQGYPDPQSSMYGGYPSSGMPMNMSIGQPGHAVVIQPNMNGAPPTVRQIPMSQAGV